MTNFPQLRLFRSLSFVLLTTSLPAMHAVAQTGRAGAAASESPAVVRLAAGWTALASGKRDEALRIADELLKNDPRSHHAAALKIEALSATDGTRALDAYEAWLLPDRPEDYGLLDAVARGVLRDLTRTADRELQLLALARLAQAGDTAAAAGVQAWKGPARVVGDVALARAGDAAALARLQQSHTFEAGDPQEIADALASGGSSSMPALSGMLKDPRPPVRAAAIAALGRMDPKIARTALTDAASDQDPAVRSTVAFALARQGDAAAVQKVEGLLASPVPDVRLMAADALRGRGDRWKSAIVPLLDDENPVTRLQAARLLAESEPEAARRTLAAALADPNPAVQAEAAATLGRIAASSPAAVRIDELRKLLRSADALLRLHAAGTLLALGHPGR